jgi:hypothetical protein
VRTLLTFDYEIFFGPRTGTLERTLIEPTEALTKVAGRHGAKCVFFVDAGYILRLREEMRRHPELRAQHDAVAGQVESLAHAGHEIQLHIHPHWEDSHWIDGAWRMDTSRYALHSFAPHEIRDIVFRYAGVLRELAGPKSAWAYRAGGWVIQPFHKLRRALADAGVTIDSTVYAGGRSEGAVQPFNFETAPAKSRWRFEADPLVEVEDGAFLEVPIASRRLKPDFFWRLAWAKKMGGSRHRAFGDGAAIALERGDLMRKLFQPTTSVVSLDGYKASFLEEAADDYRARGLEDFVVIGHPKALSPYSLERLAAFLAGGRAGEVSTFAAYH